MGLNKRTGPGLRKSWTNGPPEKCQSCGGAFKAGVAADAKDSRDDCWKWMCLGCFSRYSLGLGVGMGRAWTEMADRGWQPHPLTSGG